MNLLVIGGGGRENALVWKLSQSPMAEKIYAIPGNPGMEGMADIVDDIDVLDNAAVTEFAKSHDIGLAVVGSEAPLANGVVDALSEAGIKTFGPTKAAAEIEVSKAFSKMLMEKYGIPTAKYKVFSDIVSAREYVRQEGAPIVIKADGLAAGKGVTVAMTLDEALEALDIIMSDKTFGDAGSRVVIEEYMRGEEVSVLCFADGENAVQMVPSQDHKCAYDGDRGPNTGGMGTYAPAPVATPEIRQRVQEEIIDPVMEAMRKEGRPYKGCLYAGLMITDEGPKVVEFNARFGDPETQVVLPLLESDLVSIMLACIDGKLKEQEINWSKGAAVCVVMASGGYPKAYGKGYQIDVINDAISDNCLVFHAGTAKKDGKVVTNGGRVLGVVGRGAEIREAVDAAYAGVADISFKAEFHRNDIAHRALERL